MRLTETHLVHLTTARVRQVHEIFARLKLSSIGYAFESIDTVVSAASYFAMSGFNFNGVYHSAIIQIQSLCCFNHYAAPHKTNSRQGLLILHNLPLQDTAKDKVLPQV